MVLLVSIVIGRDKIATAFYFLAFTRYDQVMQAKLRLTLLGAPQAWLEGKLVQGYRTAKTQALFYYLAVTQRAHTRGALATLLWGDMPERNALVSLSKSLSNLRDLFPGYLEIDRHFVAFGGNGGYWLDVAAFETGFLVPQLPQPISSPPSTQAIPRDEPNLRQLRQVVEIYQGDFLAGFTVNDAPDFDAWQSTESQRLRELAIHGLDTLSQRYAALGNWAEAIACCRQILTLEPWREETHRQLMRLLVADGQRSAALIQYEICQRTLEDELAVEVSPETLELYEEILAGSSVDNANDHGEAQRQATRQRESERTHARLPAQRLPALIGRDEELARLHKRIHDPNRRLITLIGPGGVGKTTLALACAETALGEYADGIWYIGLGGASYQNVDDPPEVVEATLMATLVDLLGIPFSGPQAPEAEIANFLHNKHLLLVLDNFDPFVPVASLLTPLLAKASGLHILVTSREALSLADEELFPLSHMPVPDVGLKLYNEGEISSTHLMRFASVALFVQCAQRIQADFHLNSSNALAIAHVCHAVDGLPLGIELAATWLTALSPDEIAEELGRGLDLLDAPPLPTARQRTGIRGVFERSWQLLTPQERQCAAQFAVFQGGASREAALWVTEAALPQLSALINKSMLRRNASGRYEMHELLRQYCAEKLAEEYNPGAVHTRHSTYYLMFVQEREKAIKRKDAKRSIQEMRLELDNIRQAWRWATQQGSIAVVQRTLPGYARLYILMGLHEEASATLEWTVNDVRGRAGSLTNSREAHQAFCELCSGLLSHAAAFLNRQALFDRAIVLAQAAQQMVQALDAPIYTAHALLRESEAYWYQGRMAEAKPLLEQVMKLTSDASLLDIEPQEHRADALCIQGSIAVRMGKYKEAINAYESSLHISRALQDTYREGRALHSLGTTFRNQGHFGEARSYLEQGLQLSRQTGDLHSESRSLNSLGDIAYYLGDYMDAQRNFSQVRDLAMQIGDRRSESIAITNLGIITRDLGAYAKAKELLLQGLQVAREIGFRRGEAWALVCLSLLFHQDQKDLAAYDYGQQGLRIFVELSDDVGQAYAWTEIGHALAGLQRLDEAVAAYEQALGLRRALTQPHLEMEVLAGLIRVDLARQDASEANRKAQNLLTYLEINRLLGAEEPVHVYWTCYRALLSVNHAQKVLSDAKRMLEERAAAIDDEPLRNSFLQEIVVHRVVMQTWIAEGRKRAY